MRKLFILCIGIFFAQQAAATSQCSFKAEADIHCDNCITLHDFALFGAAALSGNYGYFSDAISPTGKTIRVTGNNGSNVVVTKRPAWDPGSLSITAGKYGEWGINFNYPSPFEAQVEASDLNNIATGKRGYSERIPYPVLNAKCKQIEKKEKAESERGRTLESLTWSIEASVMNPDYNVNLNNHYRFDGYLEGRTLFPPRRWPGDCWGTETGVMCEPDSVNSRPY